MSNFGQGFLFRSLPAIYRVRDEETGGGLAALLAVLEKQLATLETDLIASHDDSFIETCSLWVIPYLADLVGYDGLAQGENIFPSQRRAVANAIAYQRSKGSLAVLEHVLRDVTSWPALAVEGADHLARTAHLNAPRENREAGCVQLRKFCARAQSNRPFSRSSRTLSVSSGSSLARPAALSLYFWRLRSHRVQESVPYSLEPSSPPNQEAKGLQTFHPFGACLPLFHFPEEPSSLEGGGSAVTLPVPITRGQLAAGLAEYAAQYAHRPLALRPVNSRFYGPDRGLNVLLRRKREGRPSSVIQITPLEVVCMDLTGNLPRGARPSKRQRVAIDPEAGRLLWLRSKPPRGELTVTYSYGFSAELGGGPYYRAAPASLPRNPGFCFDVAKECVPGNRCVASVSAALASWEEYCQRNPNQPVGLIRILDHGVYEEPFAFEVPPGAHLCVMALPGMRPCLGSDRPIQVVASGEGEPHAAQSATRLLQLNGLLLRGALEIENDADLRLIVEHCTLVQKKNGQLIPTGLRCTVSKRESAQFEAKIRHSITGGFTLAGQGTVGVSDSIVDGDLVSGSDGAPGPAVHLKRVTVFGRAQVAELTAADVIFTGDVALGSGVHLRHSYNPDPRRPAERPRFTSLRCAEPGYAQLSRNCPSSIRGGGSGGSEMGVFHALHHSQAEAALTKALEKFLPLGLAASVEYVT